MRTIWKVLLATALPLLVMTAIGLALLAQGDETGGRGTLVTGVIVAALGGSSFIYRIDGWSLRKQSVAHFAIMLVTVLPALLLSGWFDLSSMTGWWVAITVFVLWGAGLWAVFYLVFTIGERRRK